MFLAEQMGRRQLTLTLGALLLMPAERARISGLITAVFSLAAGFLIAHIGRYKAFAIIGFGLCLVGSLVLGVLGPEVPYVALGATLVVLGIGGGMIFPTLTLSYQSAVELHELGVATSLNQFCRSIGSTLGSALFGSILILHFGSTLRASVPGPVAAWLDSPSEPVCATRSPC
jgi:MFS family permease